MEILNYNRKEMLDKGCYITPFEFSLLPEGVKMAYLDNIYDYSVKRAREKCMNGDTSSAVYSYRGYVHPSYGIYFKNNGCTVENYDFGIEEFEVRCVNPTQVYKVSSEDQELLDYYLSVLMEAKANVFESYLTRTFYAGVKRVEDIEVVAGDKETNNMLHGILCNDANGIDNLTEEEKRMVMEAELSLLIESITKGNTPDTVSKLPESYRTVLEEILESENLSREDSKQLKISKQQENLAK